MSNSIAEIFDTLKEELSKYIESTYHISNKKLIGIMSGANAE